MSHLRIQTKFCCGHQNSSSIYSPKDRGSDMNIFVIILYACEKSYALIKVSRSLTRNDNLTTQEGTYFNSYD